MSHVKRQTVIVGNWKMNKTIAETVDFIASFIPLMKNSAAQILLAVPYTAIRSAAESALDTDIFIGAQNVSDAEEGPFTGEISASMLIEAGAQFVIIGHSERRRLFHEDNQLVNRKVLHSLKDDLYPIVCVGETLKEREAGKTHEILQQQIEESLKGLSKEQMEFLMIAYEPVWAIGTGKSATPEIAQEAMLYCRELIAKSWGQAVAEKIVILYGGSINVENAGVLLEQKDIDGLLVGGASLNVETFGQIVNNQKINIVRK